MAKKEEAQPTFEEAMAQLEKFVADIASGKVGLEESLVMYEKGMELVRRCRAILDRAEKRIEVLAQADPDSSGLRASPYTGDSGDAPMPPAKQS